MPSLPPRFRVGCLEPRGGYAVDKHAHAFLGGVFIASRDNWFAMNDESKESRAFQLDLEAMPNRKARRKVKGQLKGGARRIERALVRLKKKLVIKNQEPIKHPKAQE